MPNNSKIQGWVTIEDILWHKQPEVLIKLKNMFLRKEDQIKIAKN